MLNLTVDPSPLILLLLLLQFTDYYENGTPNPPLARVVRKQVQKKVTVPNNTANKKEVLPSTEANNKATVSSNTAIDKASVSSTAANNNAKIPSTTANDAATVPSTTPKNKATVPSTMPNNEAAVPTAMANNVSLRSMVPRVSKHSVDSAVEGAAPCSGSDEPEIMPFRLVEGEEEEAASFVPLSLATSSRAGRPVRWSLDYLCENVQEGCGKVVGKGNFGEAGWALVFCVFSFVLACSFGQTGRSLVFCAFLLSFASIDGSWWCRR